MMKKILGPFPKHLIKRSKCKHFDQNGSLNWDSEAAYARYTKKNCKFLFNYIDNDDKEAQQLFDLISLMLNYDPVKRISLRSSLKHKFFDNLSLGRDKRLSD